MSMTLTFFDDVKKFHENVFETLKVHEAQNLIILGNLITGYEGKDTFGWRDPAAWVMATVSSKGAIRLVALMTPPFGLTLYAVDNAVEADALKCLSDGLIAADIAVPGVMTEKSLAQAFAEIYCGAKGLNYRTYMSLRIYQLTDVNPDVPKVGILRVAEERDLSFLPYWIEDFHRSAGVDNVADNVIKDDLEIYRYRLSRGRMHVLEVDGVAVSITQITRELMSSAGVGLVYTPPYFRGRGYASAAVAQLSQKWLDKGFKRCVLYTDLSNPTSNSIYQKIGYVPIGDSLDIRFMED